MLMNGMKILWYFFLAVFLFSPVISKKWRNYRKPNEGNINNKETDPVKND